MSSCDLLESAEKRREEKYVPLSMDAVVEAPTNPLALEEERLSKVEALDLGEVMFAPLKEMCFGKVVVRPARLEEKPGA